MRKLARLFQIKTRIEAYAITYAIAVGAVGRGMAYIEKFPGIGGKLLFGACVIVVFMVGAFLLDGIKLKAAAEQSHPAK